MLSITLQVLGFFLGIIGFIGTIILCFLPMWKMTTLNGANFEEILSEGLWMNCVTLSRGRGYDCQINLPEDLQIARVLIVIAIFVSFLEVTLAAAWMNSTNFIMEERRVIGVIVAGICLICAGFLVLIPVCWCAFTIIWNLYSPFATNKQRTELGAALYIGLVTGVLLILGGALLILDKALFILGRAFLILGSMLLILGRGLTNLGGKLLILGKAFLIMGKALLCVHSPQNEIPEYLVKDCPPSTKKKSL